MKLLACLLICCTAAAAECSVQPGDGAINNTPAIQRAIDACAKTGGTVRFPAGQYVSGTLFLKSNVTLHLDAGATLFGSKRIEDYNPKHLIYAEGATNIAIEGPGTIDGQGDAFLDAKLKPLPRPSPLIELVECKDVRISDLNIRKAAAWTIHPRLCDRVIIRGLSIVNNMLALNTDGIDPDGSRNVIISDSYIEAGDDSISENHEPAGQNCGVRKRDGDELRAGELSFGAEAGHRKLRGFPALPLFQLRNPAFAHRHCAPRERWRRDGGNSVLEHYDGDAPEGRSGRRMAHYNRYRKANGILKSERNPGREL